MNTAISDHAKNMFPIDKIADSMVQYYLWEIYAIGVDYDGETTVDGLKSVIDSMLKNSINAMENLK